MKYKQLFAYTQQHTAKTSVHIHFSLCVCVNRNRVPFFFFILCNFIAIFFSAWPSHLARLALAISKWLCSIFIVNFFSLHVFIYCKLFWARNKDCCCCCCCYSYFIILLPPMSLSYILVLQSLR